MISQLSLDKAYVYEQFSILTDDKVVYKVSEWAEAKRYLPSELSPLHGFWDNNNNPAMVEIMDCMSENSPIREVALKKGAQVGWTTAVIENFLGYIIDYCPGPTMFVTATKDMAEKAVELRIDRMIQNAGLMDKIYAQNQQADKYNRKTGNTKSKKEFPGGFILPIGSNSPNSLRMTSVKNLLMDEIDAFPVSAGKEGDPISLAEKRTNAYQHQRKVLYGSTPLIKGTSKIDKLYKKGDQRQYHVPCKDCGEFQQLIFEQISYERDDDGYLILDSVVYVCKFCGCIWKNSDKEYFLPKGKWVPTARSVNPNFRSYHLSGLYSPVGTYDWEKAVEDWIEAQTDIQKLKTFVNTVIGEPWEEKGKKNDYRVINKKRTDYSRGTVPPEVICLTAAVDVHDNLFYIEIVGWARNQVTYSIDWIELEVDNEAFSSSGWDELDDVLSKKYGNLSILMAFVDSGHKTDKVYAFCSRFTNGVFPCKGGSKFKGSNAYKTSSVAGEDNLTLIVLAGNYYKDKLFSWLNLEKKNDGEIPYGFPFYPNDYGDEFFKGYENEILMEQIDKLGNVVGHNWERRTTKAFNEPWDVRVYAMVAFDYLVDQVRADECEEDEDFSIDDFFDYMEAGNS